MATVAFQGFQPGLIQFLGELRANNNRDWFLAHRREYETYLMKPARAFVVAMGECLKSLGDDIHAEPKVHGSISAINRDTRFSADKTPYKTYVDLWFWQGNGPSRERPGYFFRPTPDQLTLGAGMHGFSETALARYRQAVFDDERGGHLERLAHKLELATAPAIELGGQTYKRVPSGCPADHPRANWLRHSGLVASTSQALPHELFSSAFPSLCFQHFQRFSELQRWLVNLLPD